MTPRIPSDQQQDPTRPSQGQHLHEGATGASTGLGCRATTAYALRLTAPTMRSMIVVFALVVLLGSLLVAFSTSAYATDGVVAEPTPRTTPRPPTMDDDGATIAAMPENVTDQPASPSNYASMADVATLYGVYEISFDYDPGTENPFTIPIDVAFAPPSGSDRTVRAFWDGDSTWRARMYVDQPGEWSWSCSSPCSTPPSTSFLVREQPASGLHGMLRVSTSPKRWYTDDGRTFLPQADTADRLFFTAPGLPDRCPQHADAAAAEQFVGDYVDDVVSHGINVLRAESLGNLAYSTPAEYDCVADLSLFWSELGSTDDLFDNVPTEAQIAIDPSQFRPNQESLSRTDRWLTKLLEEYPSIYVQMLLIPQPGSVGDDHTWTEIPADLRQRLWQAMVARWAAFPNVFWSVSDHLGDAPEGSQSYSNNISLAREIGCYWMGSEDPADCSGFTFSPGNDVWSENRPMSMGHLRDRVDSSIAEPWHTYITASSAADLAAQQMDGAFTLPPDPYPAPPPPAPVCAASPPALASYSYGEQPVPVLNVKDYYEGDVAAPAYYYRRLFWSYLLSGGGATYGAKATSSAEQTYTQAQLTGLEDIQHIGAILNDARVDLSQLVPADRERLIAITYPRPQFGVEYWTEFDRPQVARRGNQEILAYIPNTQALPSVVCGERLAAQPQDAKVRVTVDLSQLAAGSYVATWYDPEGGTISGSTPYTGQEIEAPFEGDAILRIGPPARCAGSDVCETMDGDPSAAASPYATIVTGADQNAQFITDVRQYADDLDYAGNNSWRCEWQPPTGEETSWPGCWVRTDLSSGRSAASADYYFRRNNPGAYMGLYFITVPDTEEGTPVVDGDDAASIDIFFNPEGDLFFGASQGEAGSSIIDQVVHGAAPLIDHWYHFSARVERIEEGAGATYAVRIDIDGVNVVDEQDITFTSGAPWFRRVVLHTGWWQAPDAASLPSGAYGSVWWDDLKIDSPADNELDGMFRSTLQQGVDGYYGNRATWFDYDDGWNATALLHVGADDGVKSLLHFNLANLPLDAIVDEAILQVYNTGRSNDNSLTLGAHEILADWIDSQADRTQRNAGADWSVAGMGRGADYAAEPVASAYLDHAGGAWVDMDITALAQAWLADPAQNDGLVLLQDAASGYVVYDFCSELGWTPCTQAQAPQLTVRYHLTGTIPVKATFQQGTSGYAGNNLTYFEYAGGYNNSFYFQVGANAETKALLRFDTSTIPVGKTVDEATLLVYYRGRSNGNSLTLGAHQARQNWTDSQVNWTQRQTGANWTVAGMGSGSDYLADADGGVGVLGDGGSWVELDVTDMAQAWVDDAVDNQGMALLQDAASGYVRYDFCSELGVSPCTVAQAPKLTIWYRP